MEHECNLDTYSCLMDIAAHKDTSYHYWYAPVPQHRKCKTCLQEKKNKVHFGSMEGYKNNFHFCCSGHGHARRSDFQ